MADQDKKEAKDVKTAPVEPTGPTREEIIFKNLKEKVGDAVKELVNAKSPYIIADASKILEVCKVLRDEFCFDSLMCLSGVDTRGQGLSTKPVPKDAEKGTKADPAVEEFAVVYHLGSIETKEKIAVRVSLSLENPTLPSVESIWKVANWHEREAYDMFGFNFEGHSNLTRILCPDDWIGYPLRKDYEMPTSYGNVRHERRDSGSELLRKEKEALETKGGQS
ncbi:MAG: NADH-quinone oxidoreductase subunit C [Candidatus Lindowbacteria bacterium]|nr:NADH-quinone oxidoreductase subunit C [Candidatus Lindowbacteria bacterium]